MATKVPFDQKVADENNSILAGFNLEHEKTKSAWEKAENELTLDIAKTFLDQPTSVGVNLTKAKVLDFIQNNWSQQQILLCAINYLADKGEKKAIRAFKGSDPFEMLAAMVKRNLPNNGE